MTLRERLKNINPFRREKEQLRVDQYGGTLRTYGNTFQIAGRQDKIFNVFEKCGLEYDKIDPYTQMKLSRMMYSIFPFVKRAVNDISGMVGNIKLTGDLSEEEISRLNEIAMDLPILSEHDWEKPHERGFNNLVKRIARTALKDGMCFFESRQGESGEYIGELLFDSANFHYEYTGLNPFELRYQQNQTPDFESGLFKFVGYDFTNEHPYASPLVAGGGFFTHIIISMLVALKNTNMRKGAPVELGLITVKDDEQIGRNETRATEFVRAVDDITEDLKTASQAQLDGVPMTIISKMPINVELLTKAFGAELISEVDHNLLSIVLVQIMNLLEVPPEFFGVVLGSSGFSGERFRIMYKIWSGKIDDLREKIKPVVQQILVEYLLSEKVDPRTIQGIKFEFINPSIMDEKEQAETNKLQAEADKIRVEVAMGLAANDTESAQNYLQKYGLIEE